MCLHKLLTEEEQDEIRSGKIIEVTDEILSEVFPDLIKVKTPLIKYETDMYQTIFDEWKIQSSAFLGQETDLIETLIDPKNIIATPEDVLYPVKISPEALAQFHTKADIYLGKNLADEVVDGVQRTLATFYVISKKAAAKELGVSVGAFTVKDTAALKALNGDLKFWVRNGYNESISQKINQAAYRVVEQGLPTTEAAALMKQTLGEKLLESDFYWNIVANAATNRARNFGKINQYREYDVTTYEIIAVVDSRTTPYCLFMNGRVFRVESAARIVDEVTGETDPLKIKALHPWLKFDSIRAKAGLDAIGLEKEDGMLWLPDSKFSGSRFLGDVKDMGVNAVLEVQGVSLPPYHARCRTDSVITKEAVREFLGTKGG